VINNRGKSIPLIDLRASINIRVAEDEYKPSNVIITEYNRSVQGFMIGQIMNIVNTFWDEIQPPPKSAGRNHFLTAITRINHGKDEELVEIIDVEKVLAEIIHYDVSVSDDVVDESLSDHLKGKTVLIVDDSSVARQQIKDTLMPFGIEIIERENGKDALMLLQSWANEGTRPTDKILMMYTDAEMPEMDGYRLTAEVRKDERMSDLFITLNTSLSGNFNEAMVKKVGCDKFISKFQPDLLIQALQERVRQVINH
ncbi:MAG: chemotaxis protein CheW, partial [Pseudomonadota bacterium]